MARVPSLLFCRSPCIVGITRFHHSPTGAMQPEAKCVTGDFPVRKHFHEDVCHHVVGGAVHELDDLGRDCVSDEMVLYVNMLGMGMIVVIFEQCKRCLVVTMHSGCFCN
jgi:hypothetical protein